MSSALKISNFAQVKHEFTGMGVLLRFMLRRDRIKLPAWVGGLTIFVVYVVSAIPAAYGSGEELKTVTSLFADPVGRMLTGPGYGLLENVNLEKVVSAGYGLYLMILAALMSVFLVVRHTRVEEQTGRAELVRASAVGRSAGLTATAVMALITNALASLSVFVTLITLGAFDVTGSLLFAISIGAVGLAFSGVAMITVQLSEYSRAAAGSAGAAIGAAFIIRAGGDMAAEGGSALSWASPLGWAQQTAPYVLNRWWPIILLLAFAIACTLIGYFLSTKRDLGASLVAARPGLARARPYLGTPLGLAFRLQRASLIGWTLSMLLTGMIMGAYSDSLLASIDDLPDVFSDLFGGSEVLFMGYLAYMAVFMAYLAGIYAITTVQGLRKEEKIGRADPILALPISRSRWLASNLIISVIGVALIMLATGVSTGFATTLVTGDWSYIADVTLAHLNHVPAVLVILGIATFLFGVWPRLIAIAWFVLGLSFFVGTFGGLVKIPEIFNKLVPYEHLASMPVEQFNILPFLILLSIFAITYLLGLIGLRARNIDTK